MLVIPRKLGDHIIEDAPMSISSTQPFERPIEADNALRQRPAPTIMEAEAKDSADVALKSIATADIVNQIEQALRKTGYLSFRNLHVRVVGTVAILRGRVPSYYLKQKALTVTFTIVGIDNVQNDLDVVFPRLDRPTPD